MFANGGNRIYGGASRALAGVELDFTKAATYGPNGTDIRFGVES